MKKIMVGGLIALAAGLGGSVAVQAQTAETPVRGGTAIAVLPQEPTSLNPALSTNVSDRVLGCIMYEGLLMVSPDYKLMPGLAKSWTVSPDGLTYTFELQKATWHDGKPFTSEDVAYSLPEVSAKYSSIFAPAGRVIDKIETPAPDKVVIKLKRSFGPFLISLGCIQGAAIMPAHIFKGTEPLKTAANVSQLAGTGSFKYASWQHGDHVKLVKNTNYYVEGKPYLDEIIGKVISQASARLQALQAGEVDVSRAFPPNYLAAVRATPSLKVETSDSAPLATYVFMNTKRKPYDNKLVRKALYMAIDRDYIFKNAFFEVGQVGTAPFTTEIAWAANPDIDYRKMYPFDPAKANAMLDEAGVKRGPDGKRFSTTISIFTNQYPEFQQVAAAMRSMWQAIGVEASTEALEDATMIKKVFTEMDFDATVQTYTSYSDPALGVARTWSTGVIGKSYGNPSGYSNPVVDDLFDKGEGGIDFNTRGPFYKEAQAIVAEDLPVFTLRQYRENDAASKRLRGVWGKVQGSGYWAEGWLAK